MRVADFSFALPESFIAFYPLKERSQSRLLSLDGVTGALSHGIFTDLLDKVTAGDLMVFNNTRVIPARLFGRKASGGKLEILVERILDKQRVLAHLRASKAPKVGTQLWLGDDEQISATVVARHDALFELHFAIDDNILDLLDKAGHIPLPPYIERSDEQLDQERYQTVYNEHPGAVAAPTAGLHFDHPLLAELRDKGVEIAFITLHVGAGTFQPVRMKEVEQHVMHAEYVEVPEAVAKAVIECKARGNRVIAVGTTSVRSLESAAIQSEQGLIAPFFGDTRIFIYPGYQFRIVDALITNFHLPESTLLMLVCAFAGYSHVMAAYRTAVVEHYRFFSYGDAMFITRNPQAEQEIPS